MTSDNDADHPPRPVEEEDRILGRVIWFGPMKAVVVGGEGEKQRKDARRYDTDEV